MKYAQEMLRDIEEWSGIHEMQSEEFRHRVKEYALQVARDAVDDETSVLAYRSDIHPNHHALAIKEHQRILNHIESNLMEE